jgi:diguanylate cyclase (GGDEF)-like protein
MPPRGMNLKRLYNFRFEPKPMIQFHSLENPQLERFLERHKAGLSLRDEVDLDLVLRQILQKANEFVPSESGSILLDDPFRKVGSRSDNELVFIATFGESSQGLVGHRLSARHGIVGRVYQAGTPYLAGDVEKDPNFYGQIDQSIGHKTHSVVAVPIYIGKHVCGVLELINRLEGKSFTRRDMTLLEIFAGYTSFTLQNALDAKRAHELAKKDDLTGLFNDRWFHVRLTETLTEAKTTGNPAVLIFMDLDRFKVVNDCHGHLAGSQVLREVGFVLKRVVQRPNATVARYGGDEFVMILPETTVDEGVRICDEICRTIEETTFLEREWGFSMPALKLRGILSASIGMAAYVPQDSGDTSIDIEKSELLRRADAAMYRAKSNGKNQYVVWDPSLSPATAGGEFSPR